MKMHLSQSVSLKIFNLAKKFPMLPNFSGSKRIYYLTSIRKIEKELIKLIVKRK